MHAIHHWIAQNPALTLVLWTIFLGAFSAYVGSLRAPTKDSSQSYVSYFAIMQSLVLNFSRIKPQVENSPNFQAAVNIQQAQAGQAQTPVVPIPPAPSAEKP